VDTTQGQDRRRAEARESLRALLAGNERFAAGVPSRRPTGPEERAELVGGQHPSAVVLGCVDSRVPPETVFDQGVGDLLTIRTAGQSLSGVAMGSLEFGVHVLDVPLLVVLGHTHCGAVLAAISENHATGYLGDLIGEIAERLIDVVGDKDPLTATGGNLGATVDALRRFDLRSSEGDPAHIVGLMYDLASGTVEVRDDGGLLAED
jgi:carbonic anhydrase